MDARNKFVNDLNLGYKNTQTNYFSRIHDVKKEGEFTDMFSQELMRQEA